MNIYDARELQKKLYKRANTPHKYMMCRTEDNILSYHLIIALSDSNFRTIDAGFIEALSHSVDVVDVEKIIFYHDGSRYNWPRGMYLAEIIKID